MIRRYRDMNPREDAYEILDEIFFTGVSSGWVGEMYSQDPVAEILKPFNIYWCDLRGEWRLRQ